MTSLLKVAVIGLSHGVSHIPNILRHSETELVALVDVDENRLRQRCKEYEVPGFTSTEELLRVGVADAAIIAVPTEFHAVNSVACLRAGLNVLLEKPLCRNDEEVETIADALERSGRTLQIGYEMRSSRLHGTIMEHIARGDVGEVSNVWYHQHTDQARYHGTWRGLRSNMGGALFDCSVHALDIMQQWAGAPVRRIVALGNLQHQTGVCRDELPESASISIEYRNGVRGTFNFGGVNDFNDDANFGIAGTIGRIMGNPCFAGSYELRRHRGAQVGQVVFDTNLNSVGHLGFSEQFDRFVATALHSAPNVCSFRDALALHRQMQAIDRSLATGEIVTLN